MGDFLLWFGGIVVFIIIVGLFAARKSKKKRRLYEQIAPQIGFKINPDRSGYIESPPQWGITWMCAWKTVCPVSESGCPVISPSNTGSSAHTKN